jgi:hypothetical protein
LLVAGLLLQSLFAFGRLWFGLCFFFGSRYSEGSFWVFRRVPGDPEFRLGSDQHHSTAKKEKEVGTTPTPFFSDPDFRPGP